MTHQSPKTHRDPPEPRLLDDGSGSWSCTIDHFDGAGNRIPCPDSLVVLALEAVEAHRKPRVPYPGWALDEPPPVAPITRRAAFIGFVVCVAVVAAVVVLLVSRVR